MEDSDSDQEQEQATVGGHVSYDVYVKDQDFNRKSFFKQSQAFKMYPVHESTYKVDDYGEIIDHSIFSKFDQQIQPEDIVFFLLIKGIRDYRKETRNRAYSSF